MSMVIIWFMLSIAVGFVASNRGRSGILWFLLSIALSPFLMGILVFAMENLYQSAQAPNPDTHVKCPDCRELVLCDAYKCKHCGSALVPQLVGSSVNELTAMNPKKPAGKGWYLLAAAAGVTFFVIAGKSNDGSSANRQASTPYETCFAAGVAYFKSIGSYPRLRSTGETAENTARDRCGRTTGAFDTVK